MDGVWTHNVCGTRSAFICKRCSAGLAVPWPQNLAVQWQEQKACQPRGCAPARVHGSVFQSRRSAVKGSSVCAQVPTNAVKDGRWPLSDLLLKVNAPSSSSFALNSPESHCVCTKQPDIFTASSSLQPPQDRNNKRLYLISEYEVRKLCLSVASSAE